MPARRMERTAGLEPATRGMEDRCATSCATSARESALESSMALICGSLPLRACASIKPARDRGDAMRVTRLIAGGGAISTNWRKRQDLNLRGDCAPSGFRVRCHQPGSATLPNRSGTPGGNRTPSLRFWRPPLCQLSYRRVVAGAGLEPATSWLWARRAAKLLYPAKAARRGASATRIECGG